MVHVPFYLCETALAPIRESGATIRFYRISHLLEPVLDAPLAAGELLIAVDYFGLKNAAIGALEAQLGSALLVDRTQAFFRQGARGVWSFNSARKFFGVADGAFLDGPWRSDVTVRNGSVRGDHLRTADPALAFRQFREAEAALDGRIARLSESSEQSLAKIDYDAVARRRRENFALLGARLGAANELELGPIRDAVPFCYPFLPRIPIAHAALHARGLFVPQLWHEVVEREGSGFEWERDLARRLLPLPIDQRYEETEMTQIADWIEGESR